MDATLVPGDLRQFDAPFLKLSSLLQELLLLSLVLLDFLLKHVGH